jgi:hypothetical protein
VAPLKSLLFMTTFHLRKSHSMKIHILTIFFSNTIICSIFAIDLTIILCSQLRLEVLIAFDDALVEVIHDNRSISCHRFTNSFNGAHLQEPIKTAAAVDGENMAI